jgi:hypothetical protein
MTPRYGIKGPGSPICLPHVCITCDIGLPLLPFLLSVSFGSMAQAEERICVHGEENCAIWHKGKGLSSLASPTWNLEFSLSLQESGISVAVHGLCLAGVHCIFFFKTALSKLT